MTTQTVNSGRQGFISAARRSLIAVCWLYALGVVVRVFAVGMVFLAGQGGWLEIHRATGHALGLFAIAALLAGLFGRLPRPLLAAAFGLFVLHGLQYAFVESSGFVQAFHAVNAVVIFWLTTSLASADVESVAVGTTARHSSAHHPCTNLKHHSPGLSCLEEGIGL